MNCKRVEELLPLYAGHDLEDESASLIAAHLQTCTACAGSAREYEEANQLFQQFEPPQFSDGAYAAVRHSVLREIEKGSGALTLRELLLRPFQPRAMWAVSTAVLLAVCAFAYYFIANRAGAPGVNRANTLVESATAGTAGSSPALASSSPKVGLNETTPKRIVDSPPASGTGSRKQGLNTKAQIAWHSRRASEPRAVPGKAVQYSPEIPEDKPLNASVGSGKTLRLEIQTQDPNIRIIWFSQPAKNEGSPSESSKGI